MSRKRESELAITEVVTETIGGAVHVALSSKELSTRQRTKLSRPVKRARYLSTPCKVDISLKINEFEKPIPLRSETSLFVNSAPKVLRFLRDLKPVRVELGQPIGLDCEIEAETKPVEIVWFRNGSKLIGDRYRTTSVLPRIALDISRSLVDDAGDYEVSVKNADGAITSHAPVVVLYEKPFFDVPLKDTDVHVHKAAQLICRLRAFPRAKVTWLASGVRLQPVEETFRMEESDDGLEQRLTIQRVSVEDLRKLYTCHAVNEVGEAQTSANLKPIVPLKPPEFVERFHDKSVEEGQPLALLGKVIGFPKPTLKWMRNDVVLKATANLTTAEDEDGRCQLGLPEVGKDMAGTYTCVAENEVGLAKCVARITVTDRMLPPIFIVNLENQESVENDKVTFTCTVQGHPLPVLTWYFKDKEVLGNVPRVKVSATGNRSDVLGHLTIDDVAMDDTGELKAVAKNQVGVAVSIANLVVKMRTIKPRVSKGPDDLEVTEEEDGKFVATVDGKPTPRIEWYKGETLIKPSDIMIYGSHDKTHSLTIKKAKLDDKGRYTIKAVNVAGETTGSAQLKVNEKLWPPVFTEEMVDAELIEDDAITFRCSVNAKPPPTIAWIKDGKELIDGVRTKSGRTDIRKDEFGLSLTITDAEMTDCGLFEVIAENSEGMASNAARLTVKMRTIPPKFLKGPDDQEIMENEVGFFQATVTGKPEPTVQWFKGSQIIKPSEIMALVKRDQAHSLTIKNAQLSHGGSYTVKAVNVAGEMDAKAKLIVHEKLWAPIFTETMENETALEEDRIFLRCSVNAKPLPSLTWFKDGHELKESRRLKSEAVKVTADEVKVVLSIDDAAMTDSGEYEVHAKNSEGEASDSTRLIVKMRTVKPALLKGPVDMVIIEDEDGYFQATITGKPEPTIQWFKDAELVRPSDVAIYASDGQKHSLLIKKAQLDDGGIYSVKAVNEAGEFVANARLIVNEKLWAPIFTKKLVDVTLIEDDVINLECIVNAKPLPSIVWHKDGKEVKEGPRIRLDGSNEKKDEVKLVLTIKDAELTDCGEFKVTARNSEGEATNAARITVKMRTIKPFFSNGPNDLVITEHDDGFFRTTVDGKPEPTVQWFKGLQLIKPSDVMVYAKDGKTHSLLIKKAQLNDEGPYNVKAVNEAGETVAKATLTVKEKLWAPVFTKKMADKILLEEDEVSLHCTVSAKPLPTLIWLKDGKDVSGVVRLKRVETKGKDEVSLSLTVIDAEMDDTGEFKVIARNSEGEASDSATLSVRMRTVRPSILKGPSDMAINEDEDGYFVATVGGKPTPTVEWLKDGVRIKPSEHEIFHSEGPTHSVTIKDAQLHDAGRYTIKAVNEAGEITASARLMVNEKLWAPIFMKDLDDAMIIEDDEICFQSVVNAKPFPSITWLKDGVDAKADHRILCKTEKIGENEVKVSLTLRDAQMDDTGEVKVTARNSEGAAFRSARLTVNMRTLKPRLVKGPVDQVIIEDDDGHFTATVDGKPEPTVQWYKDDQLIRPSSEMIYGSKDRTHALTIKNAPLNAQGIYSIKATNEAGEITAKARLTVNEKLWAPFFTQKMTDETLIEQDENYFICAVNAKPLPAITWLKDGKELVMGHRVQSESSKGKENELSLSLFIGDAEMTDAGEYRVIAKNSEGQAAISARLIVNMRTLIPTLLRGPEDLVITEDDDAQFYAIVEGKPEPMIQWLKDGVFLKPSGSIIYEKKNQTYALTMKNCQLNDRGLYAIKATNSAGEMIAGAKLTVNERLWAPVFREKMADELTIEQDEISFRCTVTAKPLPSIVWMKDGKELPENPRIRRDVIKGKDELKLFLTISGAEMEDSGEFEVLARNSEGEALDSARLGVKMRTLKPTLLKGPTDVIITEDEEAIFVATINGKPEPKVQWFKNNKLLSPSGVIVCATKDHTHWLTIRNAQLNDGGIYTVKAVNEAGELAANAKLTVIEKLWAPIFTKKMANGIIIEQDDISFRCSVSAKPLPSITWFKDGKELKESPRIKFDCRTIKDDEVSLSLYLTEAELTDVGEFKVIARNSEGEAANLAALTVNMRTVKPIVLKGPTDLTLTETEDGHFYAIVDGKPEPQVQWFKDKVLLSSSEHVTLSVTDRTHTVAIRNAQLHDAGLITVRAANVAGEISASARLTVREKLWAPFFTEKMADEGLIEGEEICLQCTVNAKPLPTITWLKDGKVLKEIPRINRAQVKGKGNDMKLYLTISETELDDSGKFEVVAKNSEGEAIDSSRLIVKLRTRAPMILKKPDDLVITENEDGVFFATVDGKPEPTVSWFKDEKLIRPSELMVYASRDRTHSLTVKNAQLLNGGVYTVKAVNEAGELTANARLTVKEKLWPPFFTEKLVDKTAIEHDEVRFRCTVNAKPLPSITCIRNGKELEESPRISKDLVKGKENEVRLSITLREAEIPDSGEFKVIAKNSEGEAVTSARLDVKMRTMKPTLIKGPSDLVIVEEEDAYFWATIAAKPDPTVQWFRNDKLLRPSDHVLYESQDQTYSLILKKAQLTDDGVFTVRATNEAGDLVAKAKLTVKEKLWAPIIIEPMSDKTLTEFEELLFTCAISAKHLPTITWLKDGRELKDSLRVERQSTKRSETELLVSLRVKDAQLGDTGEYTVAAQNSVGKASDSATVSVKMRTIKPALLKGPTDLVVIEHEDATFTATIDGKPEPKVHWLRDGVRIRPSELLVCGDSDKTHWLTIKNARLNDGGQYSVKAVNDAGELTATAKLTVHEKLWAPFFTEEMSDKTFCEQDKVSFTCTVNAKPLPSITWFKDGKAVKDGHRIEIISVKGRENELKLLLTLKEAEMSDSGEYSVTAKNSEGEAAHSANLAVRMRTVKPALLRGPTDLVVIENEDAVFNATVFGKPEPRVHWLRNGREIKPSEQLILAKKDQTHWLTIKNAHLDDGGQYSVRAVNDDGEVTASAKLTVNMRTIKPTLLKGPSDLVIFEHEDATFAATIAGKPEPRVQWLKLGREIKPSDLFILTKRDQTHTLTIKNAELDDGGHYSVRAVNDAGELTAAANLTVNSRSIKPSLLKGPTDLVIIEHEDAFFSATVDGKPEPRVQWLKNGREIKASEVFILTKRDQTHSLTIRNAHLDDGGQYSVRAVNDAGELTAAAKLTVREKLWAPFFTKKMSDRAFIELDQISLACTVNAKPLPSITWIKNGRPLKSDSRIDIASVDGEENEVKIFLRLNEAEVSDSGEYSVIARNSEGEATNSAKLTVKIRTIKPTLLKGPTDLVIVEHDDAIFSATIDGKPEPRVHWLKNGREIKPSEVFVLAKRDQTHWLTIKNARLDDGGQYSVKAVNDAGELTAAAKLTVNEKLWAPFFTEEIADKAFIEQDKISFVCTVNAKPLPAIAWFREGMELEESVRIEIDSVKGRENELKLLLTVTDADLSDSGKFVVRARNPLGEASCSATLTVTVMTVKPIFLKGPSDLVVTEHEDAVFTAAINGKPEPKVQWLKNGREIKPSEFFSLSKKDQTYWLTIKNTHLDDGGQYSVRAVNDGGELISTAKLTVNEKLWAPFFTEELVDKAFNEQDKVSFVCTVNAKPLPTISWIREGVELKASSRIKIESAKERANEMKLFLTLNNVDLSDSGKIVVRARNSVGEATCSATLTVTVMTISPIFLKGPSDLVVIEHEDAFFTAAINGTPEPTVHWLKNGREIKPSEVFILSKRDQTYWLTIKNARMDDGGQYSVRAINEGGELISSAKLTVNEKLWAPFFTEELVDKAFNEQDKVSFVCTVNAKPLPTISWIREGVELKASSRIKIESAKERANEMKLFLTLNNVDLSDSGKIVVRARNSVGEATCSATLTVTVMTISPIFLKGPSDLVVIEHEDAFFTAAINGTPEPTVHWLKNGREIKPSEVFILSKRDQTYWLTIKNARMDDGGQYSVRAINDGGELVSSAKLTVREKLWAPVFTKKLADRTFFEEDRVVLECSVSANPLPSIIWSKDGKALKDTTRLKFDSVNVGATDVKLSATIVNAEKVDSGQYRIVVKNSEGEASNAAYLGVTTKTVKPMLLKGPSNLKIEEESTGSFVALVDGKPYPDVQWLKDNVPLSIGGRFITKSAGVEQTLIIKEAKRKDTGLYTVRATNGAGELKASATLEVIDMSPYFLDMLKDMSVQEGMPAVFTCKVYPDSAPVVWLTEDGEISSSDARYKISSRGHERRLEIIRTTTLNRGHFTATVGELQSTAKLDVETSETEIVETRLLWKIVEDEFMRAAAEFQCTRCRQTAVMRIESMSDPSVNITERVQSATQRRWVVKKAYISRDGEFRVDRWSVRSHVDYTVTEEGLQDVARGRLDRVRYSTQTVEFIILLMEPTAESKWMKDGEWISPSSKYAMTVMEEGSLHALVINDVQQTDEGIYTFMVLRQKVDAHFRVEGSVSTPVIHGPTRLLSMKSRQDVDTAALISQLPSPIRRAKIGSKIVMSYDNRHHASTPSSDSLQKELHDFDAKVTGIDEEDEQEEDPEEGAHEEQEEVFDDERDGGAQQPRNGRRASLVLDTGAELQPLGPLARSSSLSSLSFRPGRIGRAKSEILYFAYTESGKDKSDF